MTDKRCITIDADVAPRFTACYLRIAGNECAFIEAHTSYATPKLLTALADAGKRPEDVRYVVVTHAHLDHAAGASALVRACPNATLLAHPRAARNLIDPARLVASATSVYGAERFASLYGTIDPIPAARVRSLEDGASFEVGADTFTVHFTAGHANHHFVVDDPAFDTVYTGDTFGLVYPALQSRGRFALPSTSPTNFDAAEANKSVAKVLSLGRATVRPTHFDAYADKEAIGAQIVDLLDLAERWVVAEAGGGAEIGEMTARIRGYWRDAIAARAPWFGAAEWKVLELDIDLNAQGLAYVADARRRGATPRA